MTTEKNIETTEESSSVKKARILFWLAITLLLAASLVGVMLAFYEQPALLEDGTPNPNMLWGLENYGPFFTQVYGNTLTLGLSSFVIGATTLAAMGSISSQTKEFKLGGAITMLVLLIVGAALAGTIYIWTLSGIAIIGMIVFLILAKTTNVFFEEE